MTIGEDARASEDAHGNEGYVGRDRDAHRTGLDVLDVHGPTHGGLGEDPDELAGLEVGDRVAEGLAALLPVDGDVPHAAHERAAQPVLEDRVLGHVADEPLAPPIGRLTTEGEVEEARVVHREEGATLQGDVLLADDVELDAEATEDALGDPDDGSVRRIPTKRSGSHTHDGSGWQAGPVTDPSDAPGQHPDPASAEAHSTGSGSAESSADERSQAVALEDFILELGRAQLAAGYPVDDVTTTLNAVARAYDRTDFGIFVLPNAVMVDDPVVGRARVIPEGNETLRLDQAADVHDIAVQARRGQLDLVKGTRELEEIPDKPPRFPPWLSILGYALASAGFALVFRVSIWGVGMAAVCGLFVGVLLAYTRSRPNLAPLVPPVAATLCSFAVFSFASLLDQDVQPLRVVAAPLITLIPGAALTRATQELASGHVISGASRLVASIVQILILTFGVLVGSLLARVSPDNFADLTDQRLPLWVAWIGAAVYALGQALAFNEPRGALVPVVVLLLIAFSVQQVVSWMLDAVIAAGIAAAIALFLAIVIQDRGKRQMPAFVLFSPVFWLLVPGSLGLVALTEAITGSPDDSLPKAEGDVPVSVGAGAESSSVPTFTDLNLDSEASVALIFGASIIAITIGMQIASIAGRLVRKLPDLPDLPDVKLPGIGR